MSETERCPTCDAITPTWANAEFDDFADAIDSLRAALEAQEEHRG